MASIARHPDGQWRAKHIEAAPSGALQLPCDRCCEITRLVAVAGQLLCPACREGQVHAQQ
ncbi:hypothetical protein ACFQE5_04805 [Pseudonocardia hispaniensis]|uniref:Uncharacterized protein n=1 Tax=Pseudonocardia hispaniensis TaxID=904933 RepID=A0ABW1IZA0_9PSEU